MTQEIQSGLVSVIIPTYSRPDNLLRAIESVLNQTYGNIELIVVDDNGQDTEWQQKTQKLIAPYLNKGLLKYIVHEYNKNGSAARNTGLRHSHGEFINFLDDDDVFSKNKIEAGIAVLTKETTADAVFCDTTFIEDGKERTYINPESENIILDLLTAKLFFNTSTVLFRRQALTEINGFDESFRRQQDYELFIRFSRNHSIVKQREGLLTKYSTSNIISNNPLKRVEYMEYFLAHFKDEILSWKNGKNVFHLQYKYLARNLAYSGYPIMAIRYLLKTYRFGILHPKDALGIIYHALRHPGNS